MLTQAPSESERERDPAAAITRLLDLSAWIPLGRCDWQAIMTALFESFLRHFEGPELARLLDDQRGMAASTPAATRAARLAAEFTALHKVCQMLARNPAVPPEARAALTPLEKLPPESIPDAALSRATGLAKRARPDLRPDAREPKIGRGSVADVFRLSGQGHYTTIAFKTIRADALTRVRREAAILEKMANEAAATLGALVEPDFARTIVEALRDASRALLREVDFASEAANLRDALAFYRLNDRVRIPAVEEPVLEEGIFMEYVDGTPLMETPLDAAAGRRTARLLFRSLFLEPLFSGVQEAIFHADPHAGNILAQTRGNGEVALVLLDWSQADRLSAALRHAIVELCLHCMTGSEPPVAVLEGIMESHEKIAGISVPKGIDPLHKAFAVVEQLAEGGYRVPLSLLLLRKSFLTLDGIARELNPSFSAWRETLIYSCWVFASEVPTRAWSLPFPWWDQPAFYRSGLPTRMLAARLNEMCHEHASGIGAGTSD